MANPHVASEGGYTAHAVSKAMPPARHPPNSPMHLVNDVVSPTAALGIGVMLGGVVAAVLMLLLLVSATRCRWWRMRSAEEGLYIFGAPPQMASTGSELQGSGL